MPAELGQVPPYLTPSEVARSCGMSRRKAKSMLHRTGLLERIGGRWYVSESRLRERLPDVYDRVYTVLVLGIADAV